MSLSICLITSDPPERLAVILEPLRPYADEVLIAADSRTDEQTQRAYSALADKLFKIEYRASERHVAWLCEQCEGSWILRMDGDEVPSAAFVERLPEMLASRTVQQFWTMTKWLYPDTAYVLDEPPWSEDFACRLMRNDGTLHSPGIQHTHIDPVCPREYIEEPFFHLDLLTSTEQARRDKVIRYEISRPHLLAPNGGRFNEAFYLPELRDSSPKRREVPGEDRARIERALERSEAPAPTGASGDIPIVSLAEMDRAWAPRTVPESAYRAKIEPVEPRASFIPSEQREVFFRVANEGTERWPAHLDEQPMIRLGYRWLHPDGGVHTSEGPRTAFTRRVNPGERLLAPLNVHAPDDPGQYALEVDIVHEEVRWFDCRCRVPARVEPQHGLPATGARLKETPSPRFKRWRKVRIPRTIHRVWTGGAMPAEHERFGVTFAHHHPDWEMRLWTEEDLPTLDITEADRRRARTHSELSNLMRYEILHRFGGIYVDTDFECLRPLTPLLRGIVAFTALELPGRTANGILGSVPGHPVFGRAAQQARLTLGEGARSTDANGPYFFSLLLEQESTVAIFPARLFYPYLWDELERRDETFPDAYAVHHWAMSWR